MCLAALPYAELGGDAGITGTFLNIIDLFSSSLVQLPSFYVFCSIFQLTAFMNLSRVISTSDHWQLKTEQNVGVQGTL